MFRQTIVVLLVCLAPGSLALTNRSPQPLPRNGVEKDTNRRQWLRQGLLTSIVTGMAGMTQIPLPAVAAFGEEAPVPMDLGVFGLKVGTGTLGVCPGTGRVRPCISTSVKEASAIYVPPLTYLPLETPEYGVPTVKKGNADKSQAEALEELKAAITSLGGTITQVGVDGRYVRTEFRTYGGLPGSAPSIDDVEFLFEVKSDPAGLVNYRSATRPDSGGDNKRHRQRIKDIRLKLQENGWQSIGRYLS